MPELATPFPFFLGCGRSGTTLIRLMFDAHPQMAIPTEATFPLVARADWVGPDGRMDVDRVLETLEARKWLRRWHLDPAAVRTAAHDSHPQDYADVLRALYRLYADTHGKPRYGNKTPKHVYSIPALAELFPEGRFVHIVRDGRDVALSYMDQRFGPTDLGTGARVWARRVELGRRRGSELSEGRYTEVRYEDLLEDPERELRRLCAFIDLPFDEQMLRYHEKRRDRELRRDPDRHLAKPPTKGLRDWRSQLSRSDQLLFESIAGETLDAFGYPRSGAGASGTDRLRVRMRTTTSRTRRRLQLLGRRVRPRSATRA